MKQNNMRARLARPDVDEAEADEHIRRECERIRRTWDAKRLKLVPEPVELRVIHVAAIRGAVGE